MQGLLRFLGWSGRQFPSFRAMSVETARSQSLIRVFYAFAVFQALADMDSWSGFIARESIDPLWPVFWLGHGDPADGILLAILVIHLISALTALCVPESRAARIFFFIAFFEMLAFRNSFGKINHWGHLMLLVAFILIFLPKGWASRSLNRMAQAKVIQTMKACLGVVLVTYTMSGLGKVVVGIGQAIQGEPHALAPDALARHIADRITETGQVGYLAEPFIQHPWLGWPLMLTAIYLQLSSIFVLFRPELHRIWGSAHLLFHVGVYFTMTISFNESAWMVSLLLIASPFAPTKIYLRKTLEALPLLGRIWRH